MELNGTREKEKKWTRTWNLIINANKKSCRTKLTEWAQIQVFVTMVDNSLDLRFFFLCPDFDGTFFFLFSFVSTTNFFRILFIFYPYSAHFFLSFCVRIETCWDNNFVLVFFSFGARVWNIEQNVFKFEKNAIIVASHSVWMRCGYNVTCSTVVVRMRDFHCFNCRLKSTIECQILS